MRTVQPIALLAVLLLTAALVSAPQALAGDEKKPELSSAPSVAKASVPCKEFASALKKAAPADRIALIASSAEARCPEAESLAVKMIESGRWADGEALTLGDGVKLIRGIRSGLTTYRVHLLLDIYEQMTDQGVRRAVLHALNGSPLNEALLPALDAYWEGSGAVKQTAASIVGAQPEVSAPKVLARLIRKLPDGPLLAWALRLADRHPSAELTGARNARKVK